MARVKQQNTIIGVGSNPTRDELMKFQFGTNDPSAWARMQENMLRIGSLKNKVDPSKFYDNRFIAAANKFDREKVFKMASTYKK